MNTDSKHLAGCTLCSLLRDVGFGEVSSGDLYPKWNRAHVVIDLLLISLAHDSPAAWVLEFSLKRAVNAW